MAAHPDLIAQIDELVALFNRQSLDLPDGLFDRRTQFLLNGTPFEAMLGRPAADPLVLMIARGPAGYRFAVKALQHAVPDARVQRGSLADGPSGEEPPREEPGEGRHREEPLGGGSDLIVPLWLSGHLRGTAAPIEVVLRVSVACSESGTVTRADLQIDPDALAMVREARLRD